MLTINNTLDGYLKDVEIKGNTIQDIENLADIRSVGDKVEGQELYEIPVLSCGKNLLKIPDSSGTSRGITFTSKDGLVTVNGTNTGYVGYDLVNGVVSDKLVSYTLTQTIIDYYSNVPNFINKPGNYTITIDSNVPDGELIFSVNVLYDNDKHLARNNMNLNASNKFSISVDSHINGIYAGCWYSGKTFNNVKLKVQFEEGTVATPYEPYQEDKLTILSPTQLEKVGDVADRLICKDGVWGVEKNIVKQVLKSSNNWSYRQRNGSFYMYQVALPIKSKRQYDKKLITNKYNNFSLSWNEQYEYCFINEYNGFIVNSLESTLEDFKASFPSNGLEIYHETATSTFIPLPHDQQIKLRTFANKTNISFLTEIEGTIKAQVPKSLGATVNTHTEQISNLNKELDRVKKLEESTVSTVETESDFTTVEATSNGYFEDVKLEGKTLATVLTCSTNNNYAKWTPVDCVSYKAVEVGKVYTIIAQTNNTAQCGLKNRTSNDYLLALAAANEFICKTITFSKAEELVIVTDTEGTVNMELMILEGDHTQNPPSYFEGLKSVGDGADEIVVSSVKGDGNLFDLNVFETLKDINNWSGDSYKNSRVLAKLKPNTTYTMTIPELCVAKNSYWIVEFMDARKTVANVFNWSHNNSQNSNDLVVPSRKVTFTTSSGHLYINAFMNNWGNLQTMCNYLKKNFMLEEGTQATEYTQHQSDKKRLLFYNNETQTWGKPILREWDSIEKHSDGKYYYHQRSGEVVLNGSESWTIGSETFKENCYYFKVLLQSKIENFAIGGGNHICNKYVSLENGRPDSPGIAIAKGNGINTIEVLELKTNFTSYENALSSFKENTSNSNIVIVYQLAEEKVYECTNIDLITYANETNYIVESGAIVPKSILKVHNNISNVVSLLQKKVSLLESNMTKYMITQNRMQLASTYSADSVTFKVDYALCSEETEEYNEDLYNLILNNILVGKDNYDYDKMFTMILDYASWNQISWEQFDILVGLMDIQHNPPIEEIPTDDEIVEEIPNEII